MKQTVYIKGPSIVRCDNKPAIALCSGRHRCSGRLVTIGNRFYELGGHYPKEQYQNGNICVRHVRGDDNRADLPLGPTKAVGGITKEKIAKLVGWVKGIGGGAAGGAAASPNVDVKIMCWRPPVIWAGALFGENMTCRGVTQKLAERRSIERCIMVDRDLAI